MIEYLYNAIKASAGQDLAVAAQITDADGASITESCHLMLFDKDANTLLGTFDGIYISDIDSWDFIIPAAATEGLSGRYWYCLCHEDNSLCFKQPFYLS